METLLIVLIVAAVALAYKDPRRWMRRLGNAVRSMTAWNVAAVLWVGVMIASIAVSLPLALVLAILGFLPFWGHELWVLMHQDDTVFPGKNDKLIWALVLLLCPPLGVVLFRSYRERNWVSADAHAKPKVDPANEGWL